MRQAMDDHMIAVVDNGFIPEGMPQEGWVASRDAAAYPLRRLMALGAKAAARDARNAAEFTALLGDTNAIVRHWAAQGLLMLGAGASAARAKLEAMMRGDGVAQNRVVAADAVASIAHRPTRSRRLPISMARTRPVKPSPERADVHRRAGETGFATIKRAAASEQGTAECRALPRAVLEGRYEPRTPCSRGDRRARSGGVGPTRCRCGHPFHLLVAKRRADLQSRLRARLPREGISTRAARQGRLGDVRGFARAFIPTTSPPSPASR
jgi:hypothetical protein